MIRYLVARFTLLAAVVACAPAPEPQAAEDARLAAARARAQELANSTQNYQPVRFVSALEQVSPPPARTRIQPTDVLRADVDSTMADPVPVPDPVIEPEPSETAVDVAVSPRVPSIIPREAPLPDSVAVPYRRAVDPGPDMGTVIGVVLRGGPLDPNHCPRHPRPPSQIPTRIPW